jgi:hypothetical protein
LTTGLSDLRTEIAAVKVELADKPGKMWLSAAIGLLLAAYAAGLSYHRERGGVLTLIQC